jgi:hypothetical protein
VAEDIRVIVNAFQPLIGRLAWSVRRVYGSILTIEFGEPHFRVREPIIASAGASEDVRRTLARRRVHIRGEWQLEIRNARWEIVTRYTTTNSDEFEVTDLQDTLNEVDGQRLLSVEAGAEAGSFVLVFDLGASFTIRPNASDEDDQWTIHGKAASPMEQTGA